MTEFHLTTLSSKHLLLSSITILAIPLILILCFCYFYMTLSNSKIEINNNSLDMNLAFYGKTVSLNDIVIDNVSFTNDDHYLSYRTNGISLFGLNWGWFKLKNGRKALVFITGKGKTVFVPTKSNFDMIFSLENPSKFIETIKTKGN